MDNKVIEKVEATKEVKYSKHNGIISFWKFMFTLMIIFGHVTLEMVRILGYEAPKKWVFMGSAVGVEFFFIVSGYLMTKKALNVDVDDTKQLGKATFDFLWKKIKAFFPYVLIAYICSLILQITVYNMSAVQAFRSIWDLTFLRMSGIQYPVILGVAWYISAMLISMLILYPLNVKYKKNFVYIIAPLNVIFIGGYISYVYLNPGDPTIWTGVVFKSLLRGYFEISLGSIAYLFSKYIKNIKFTNLGRVCLTLIEVLGFGSTFILVNLYEAHNRYDFLIILILFICVSIAFSEKSLLQRFSNNRFFYFLEKISFPMYLQQMWVIYLFLQILKDNNISSNYYANAVMISILIFIVALITEQIVKIIKNNYPRIKSLFIEKENI